MDFDVQDQFRNLSMLQSVGIFFLGLIFIPITLVVCMVCLPFICFYIIVLKIFNTMKECIHGSIFDEKYDIV
jgi:fatty acid desaturase